MAEEASKERNDLELGYISPDSAAQNAHEESFILTDNEDGYQAVCDSGDNQGDQQLNRRRAYSVNDIPRKSAAAIKRYIVNGWNNLSTSNSRDVDFFDGESGSSISEESSLDDSLPESAQELTRDQLEGMPPFPSNFVDSTSPLGPCSTVQPISELTASRLIVEQRMLINAALQLFMTRDAIGVEGSVHERHNIVKQGPLKKLSGKYWKIKYVEVRKGNLCYYEDSGRGRKILHLRYDTIVKSDKENCFEIFVQGSPSRTWMAHSEEEKAAWMKAIETSKIGGESTRQIDVTLYNDAIEVFEEMKQELATVTTKESYATTLYEFLDDWSTFQIPIQWVREQVNIPIGTQRGTRHLPKDIKSQISDFWRQMASVTFSINDNSIARTTPFASERVFGGLVRCILDFDQAFSEHLEDTDTQQISAVQATSYARDVLLDVLKSRENGDADLVINHLLKKPGCVSIERRNREETVFLEVSFAGDDCQQDNTHTVNERSGWIRTRRRNTKTWRKRFAILSGAILAHYEAATPRPHGLRGQLVLGGATVKDESTDEMFVLCVSTFEEERLLAFESKSDLSSWRDAIQSSIDSCVVTSAPSPLTRRKQFLKGANRLVKNAIPDANFRGGIRVIRSATGGGIKVIKSAKDGSIKVIRGAVGLLRAKSTDDREGSSKRRPSIQVLMDTSEEAMRLEPTVQCVAQQCLTYDVLGLDRVNLVTVHAKLFQAFLLSGGPQGAIKKGDSVVELDFNRPI